jgi:hypothetical protein
MSLAHSNVRLLELSYTHLVPSQSRPPSSSFFSSIGLSAAEFEAVLSALDGDNDGRISLKEFESFVNNADDLMHAILEVGI